MKLGEYERVEAIHDILSRWYDRFPFEKCHTAARSLNEFAGLDIVSGLYVYQWGSLPPEPHHWNQDPKSGLYVDITQYQFQAKPGKTIPQIVVDLPSKLPQLKPDNGTSTPPALPQHIQDLLNRELHERRLR